MIRPLVPSKVDSRFLLLLVSSCCFSTALFGVAPERLPSYSNSREMREDSTLRAVAFLDQQHGVTCGDRGTILLTDDGGQSWVTQNCGVDCRLSDVVWIDNQRLIVVGGGYDRITQIGRAVVLFSQDGGKRWRQMAVNDLPALTKIQRRKDGSLTAIGDWSHAMLTDRFASHDDGKTWIADFDPRPGIVRQFQPNLQQMTRWINATGIPVAIRDACQIGDSSLFAVGDHGVILVSRDAGRTWNPSRGQGRQTSVLMVARDRTSVAWGIVGKEAIEHRNRVSVLIDHPSGVSPGLANQVTAMLGGASADNFDSQAPNITTRAKKWIAIHRPSVLVVDHAIDVKVQDAFIQAATSSGVARVVVYRRGGGSTVIHRDALLPNSGVLVRDFVSDAQQLVAPDQPVAPSIALQFQYDVAASGRQGSSVTGGVALRPGQKLTAALPPASRRQLQIIQARRTQSTRVRRLIGTTPSPSQFADSLKTILNQTAREDQFRLAWSIHLETIGQETNAATLALQQVILTEISARFPNLSAGHWAQLRTSAREHSIEWIRLDRLIGGPPESLLASTANTVPVSPFQEPSSGEVRQASAVRPVQTPEPDRVNLNAREDEPMRGVDLAWEYHPIVLLSRAASRQRGDGNQLQSVEGPSAEIKRLAQSEQDRWSPLVRPSGPQTLLARPTTDPPRLDGILDDPCWESALTMASETRVRFSYDDEFFYVGFETSADRFRFDSSATAADQRARDRDLTQVDRLRLRIDTDRDLLTSYRFEVSASGQTYDAIDGDRSWNPTWYRETRQQKGRVTIEMAILRRDLADLPIHAGESWYVSAQALAAGTGSKPMILPNPGQWLRVDFR